MSYVLLSAGGTGGHIYPAKALAEALQARNVSVKYAIDGRAKRFFNDQDAQQFVLPAGHFNGSAFKKIIGISKLGLGILGAFFLLLRKRPHIVVGFGGYSSVPAVLAAQILCIPTILHEGNAVLGKANKLLLPFSRKLALSWPSQQAYGGKAVVTGLPIRMSIQNEAIEKKTSFNILIIGGSLGAKILSTPVAQALTQLPQSIHDDIHITHQVRDDDQSMVQNIYAGTQLKVEVASYFNDLDKRYAHTDLYIGRSGASTVAELLMAGVPAIYCPLTVHTDNQQYHNAKYAENHNAAIILEEKDFTPQNLSQALTTLYNSPQDLQKMRYNAKESAFPDAAETLAKQVQALYK